MPKPSRTRRSRPGTVVSVLAAALAWTSPPLSHAEAPSMPSSHSSAIHSEHPDDAGHAELPMLTVTGRAEVSVKPDRAVLNTGVIAQEPTAEGAMKRCADEMNRVIGAIGLHGIAVERMQTSSVSLSPVFEQVRFDQQREPREPKIIAYRAENTVRVEIDDLTKIGAVIDAAVKAGANQSFGIGFEIKDDAPHRREALTRAVAVARAKAETIAAALSRPLGEILEASEGVQTNWPRPMTRGRFAGAMEAAADSGTPIAPGELRVEATVTLRYAIAKPK